MAFEQEFGVEEGQYMEASIISPPCVNNGFDGRSSGDSVSSPKIRTKLSNESVINIKVIK